MPPLGLPECASRWMGATGRMIAAAGWRCDGRAKKIAGALSSPAGSNASDWTRSLAKTTAVKTEMPSDAVGQTSQKT
jgi:hypothetical protein